MANTFLNSSGAAKVIAKAMAIHVKNNMVMGNLVNRQFKNEFVKIGDTITYRKPVKFVVNDGADITNQIQDIDEPSDTIVVDQRKNVAFEIPAVDLTLRIEKIIERYVKPASIRLANKVDTSLLGLYKNVYNASGTAGTTPSTYLGVAGAAKVLTKFAVPNENRSLVVDPEAQFTIPDGLKGILDTKIVRPIIEDAKVGRVATLDIFGDQNVKYHAKGTATGTPLVYGASQSGTSLSTDGWTGGVTNILKQGDIFTIAGVNSVNPVSYEDTGDLQQFVVTADVDSNGAGSATIPISPSIAVASGVYTTVTAKPADNAAITVVGSHRANLAFTRDAFALVLVPIVTPEDAKGETITYEDVSIRYVKWYDGKTDKQIYRFDILYGVKCTYPEFACRLLG